MIRAASLVPLMVISACARREEAPAAPAPVVATAGAPMVVGTVVVDAAVAEEADAGPVLHPVEPIRQGHFIYVGPQTDLARTRARVDRAFVEQGKTNRNGSLPSLRKLDTELKENYVTITVEGRRLRGEMSPALPDPSWDAVFSIDEDDHVVDLVVGTIARNPSRPRRP